MLGKTFLRPQRDMQQVPEQEIEPAGRWLRRIGRDEFRRLMGASIEAALEIALPERHRAREVRQDALRRFSLLLAARTQPVRALTRAEVVRELERTHGALQRQRVVNAGELSALGRELGQARERSDGSGLTDGEEQALQRALASDLEVLLRHGDPRKAVAAVLERERVRRAAAVDGALLRERARIDVLERRIAKLREAQTAMERDLVELARRAELDPGVPSIYRTVQGLAAEEAEREAKARMLADVFAQNLELQCRASSSARSAP